jgi:hypothetical protein
MKLEQIDLTPELAAELLAKPHPKQRRPAPSTVKTYMRAMIEGRWTLILDPILLDAQGRMFNGAHRCAAVVDSGVTIPVYIGRDADAEMFDVIDVGRRRSAYQFIRETDAKSRASAARVTLWYAKRFERPLGGVVLSFDLHEVMAETDRLSEVFEVVLPAARSTVEYTKLPMSVTLGAYATAREEGHGLSVESFADSVERPEEWKGSPGQLLAERFRKESYRGRRRSTVDDWTILVCALNYHIEGKQPSKLVLTDVWPKIGEPTAEFQRRVKNAHDARTLAVRRSVSKDLDADRKRAAS